MINIDVTNAVCRTCGILLSDPADLTRHAKSHDFPVIPGHPDGVIPFLLDKNSWSCFSCSEKFNNFLKLYEHMNFHYQHYICSKCGKGFMTAYRLRKHMTSHVFGSFSCDSCDRVFCNQAAREYHKVNSHPKGPRYECPKCQLRFDKYYERMRHLIEVHREKEVTYRCVHCDLGFKTSSKRAAHMKSAHLSIARLSSLATLSCPRCGVTFESTYLLKYHLKYHPEDDSCPIVAKV